MTDRERLLEILNVPIYPHENVDPLEAVADYLLDNGVTFATDNNVGSKWIPVSERLPDKQHDWVLVACKLTPEDVYGVPHIGELRNGVWWDDCYEVPLKDAGVEVTHWMPLPEPPKEEDDD